MTLQAEEIAASLTKAQRRAIIAWPRNWPPTGPGMWPLRNGLAAKQLTRGFGAQEPLPLFHAVRTAILDQEKGK